MIKTIISLFTFCTLLYFIGSFSACDSGGSDSDSGGGTVYIYPIKGTFNMDGGDYDANDDGNALPEMVEMCKNHFDTAFTNADAPNVSKDRVAPFVSVSGKDLKDMPSQYGFSSNATVVGIYQDKKYTMKDKWSDMFSDPSDSIVSSLSDNGIADSSYTYYTGTSMAGTYAPIGTCSSFTSSDSGENGQIGYAASVNAAWFGGSHISCDTNNYIMCVAY